MSVVAAIPSIALLAGAAVGLLVPDSRPIVCMLRLALAISATCAFRAWFVARPIVLAAAVALGFFAGGTLLTVKTWQRAWRPPLRIVFEEWARARRSEAEAASERLAEEDAVPVTLTGVLKADAGTTSTGVSLAVSVLSVRRPDSFSGRLVRQEIASNGGVLLTVVGDLARDRIAEWRAGRLIRAPALLRRPSRYLDPGVPDEERALARRGTTLVGTVKSGALVEVIDRAGTLAETASAVRAFARRSIGFAVGRWSARASAIVTAIVIGDRDRLGADVQKRLQEAGTYHVIAISGGNIAILAALTLAAFRIAGMLGRAAMLTAIAGLVAYGYLVGGGASVNRATLMAVVYFAGRAIDLRGPPFNTLAVVAAVLVAADPLTIADPAFLLTFGATTAILAVVPALDVQRFPRLGSLFAAMLAASAAAEAALFPIGAAVFSRVTVAGLALNFGAIPLMAVAQIAGMLLVPIALVSMRLATAVGWVAFVGAEGLVRSADLVRFAPALTWRVAPPEWWWVAGYYVGAITSWTLWRWSRDPDSRPKSYLCGVRLQPDRQRQLYRIALATATTAAVWMLAEPWRLVTSTGDGRLHVTFIDVGQGDAAFVRFPRGASLVVDAGGLSSQSSFDIGDRVVGPVLREAGVKHLQILALTHGDADHIGGAPSVLSEFRPRDVWEGISVPRFEPLRSLRASAATVSARWTNVQLADVTLVDDVQVVVRHPGQADWERQKVRNDDSIVLELLWRNVSLVLTGDIGRETEQAIVSEFQPSPLRIVKVPHHGSLTSSSMPFIRALSPRVAVVSAGRSNIFGHPAPAVLDRYRAVGAEIFRTDRDGAVTVDTDGQSADVHTFTGRTASFR